MFVGSGEGQIEYAHESAIERVDEWHPVTGEMLEDLGVVLGPRHPHEPPFLGGCSDRVRANRPFGEGMAGEDADTVHLDIDGSRRSPAVEDDRSMRVVEWALALIAAVVAGVLAFIR